MEEPALTKTNMVFVKMFINGHARIQGMLGLKKIVLNYARNAKQLVLIKTRWVIVLQNISGFVLIQITLGL